MLHDASFHRPSQPRRDWMHEGARLSRPLRGLVYGVPITLLLWAVILWSAAKAFTAA